MFTGIITATTKILESTESGEGLRIVFEKPPSWEDLEIGESIATNGVCLTVAEISNNSYSCVLIPSTLRKASFGRQIPESVNLERSLKANDRLSGHIVQGHVDGMGTIRKITKYDGIDVQISFDKKMAKLVVDKGAITVDGVSLTVAEISKNNLVVALVPYTLEHTTLGSLQVGSLVNLEFDIFGKYLVRMMELHAKS